MNDEFDFTGTKEASKTTERVIDDLRTIDTINNIGSHMTSRMTDSIMKSLKNTNNRVSGMESYTYIGFPTKQIYKELGIRLPFGVDGFYGADQAYGAQDEETDKEYGTVSKYGNGMGRSVVVNPPFQFNRHDDVRVDRYTPYYGRVFNQNYVRNFPIAMIEVGRVKYNNNIFKNIINESKDSKRIDLIRGSGSDVGLLSKTASVFKTVLRTSWSIITLPISVPANIIKWMLGLDKYATFVHQTELYHNYVNDMLKLLAANMGLLTHGDTNIESELQYGVEADYAAELGGADNESGKNTPTELDNNNTDDWYMEKVKKYELESGTGDDSHIYSTLDNNTLEGTGLSDRYAGRLQKLRLRNILAMKDNYARHFVPFLVSKNVSVSESISNSTQQNPLQSQLNGAAAEAETARNNNFMSAGGKNLYEDAKKAIEDRLAVFQKSILRGETGSVISGDGRIALPEVWSDSNFSRSVSLDFKFTSPYGDRLSIFENTYMPFILLLAMTMPRQLGSKTYTSPFILRLGIKGIIQLPMCIVESLSITRGEDKNNWTESELCRTIKCTMSIKDISPTMMMGMSKGSFFPLWQGNEGFSSYMNTLGGLSVYDQNRLSSMAKRWWTQVHDTVMSYSVDVTTKLSEIVTNKENKIEPEAGKFNYITRRIPGMKTISKGMFFLGIGEGVFYTKGNEEQLKNL